MISYTGHVMTLANSIIGVGILAMPFCFQKCGIILSVILLIVNNWIARISCHYLIKSSLLTRRKSFEFLGFHAFGPSGKLLVELCIIGYLLGTCITYFVVVGDIGPQIVGKIFRLSGDFHKLRTWIMVAVTVICVLPLGMLRNVDSLSAVCTASVGFYVCLVVKVIFESEMHIIANDWTDRVVYWESSGILQCLPIFSMALSCQMQLFEVFESVNNQSVEKLNSIVKKATWICTLAYISVGFFGYIAFCTQKFSGNILLNFSQSFGSDVIKIGFVLSVAFSFPLVIFPCRASVYSLLYRKGQLDAVDFIPKNRFNIITVFIIGISLVVAILIPSVELIIGLVGSTIGVAICIMFPATCFRKISKKDSTERAFAQIIIYGGFALMILGTYANLNAIDEKSSGIIKVPLLNIPTEVSQKLPYASQVLKNEHSKDKILNHKNKSSQKITNTSSSSATSLLTEENSQINRSSLLFKSHKKFTVVPEISDEVKIIPLYITQKIHTVSSMNSVTSRMNEDAIRKNKQLASEEQQNNTNELRRAQHELKKTKELLERKVDELKEELEKQNKETQQLVAEKLGEVVQKVEQIEREVHEKDQESNSSPNNIKTEKTESVPSKIKSPKQFVLNNVKEKHNIYSISNEFKDLKKDSVYTYKGIQKKTPHIAISSDALGKHIDIFDPFSHQPGSKINGSTNVSKPDPQLPMPLAILINSSKRKEMNISSISEPNHIIGNNIYKNNNIKPRRDNNPNEELNALKERNSDKDAVGTHILDGDIPRKKRSIIPISYDEMSGNIDIKNCLTNEKVNYLISSNNMVKLQGLQHNLISIKDD